MKEKKGEISPIQIVKRYSLWSAGAGLIPFPYWDLGVVGGVQLKMLYNLSKHYGVKFSENQVKSIIAALVGTITADSLSVGSFNSLIKSIPYVGIIGMVSLPVYAGAATYAIGKVFIQHFESGGTFLDFDEKKAMDSIKRFFQEGKETVYKLKPKKV